MKHTWIAAMALGTLSGCVTKGRDFPSEVQWLKAEVTRKNDVVFQLGQPQAVGNSGGRETWTYGYYKYKLVGKSFYNELKLYWQEDQSLKHFSFNSSFPTDIRKRSKPAPTSKREDN